MRGRPDYFLGQIPSRQILATGQTGWSMRVYADIAGGGNANLLVYTTPTGYRLNVDSCVLSCDHPFIHKARILQNASVIAEVFFDSILVLPIVLNTSDAFDAGYQLRVLFYNQDIISNYFTASFSGYEELKT